MINQDKTVTPEGERKLTPESKSEPKAEVIPDAAPNPKVSDPRGP